MKKQLLFLSLFFLASCNSLDSFNSSIISATNNESSAEILVDEDGVEYTKDELESDYTFQYDASRINESIKTKSEVNYLYETDIRYKNNLIVNEEIFSGDFYYGIVEKGYENYNSESNYFAAYEIKNYEGITNLCKLTSTSFYRIIYVNGIGNEIYRSKVSFTINLEKYREVIGDGNSLYFSLFVVDSNNTQCSYKINFRCDFDKNGLYFAVTKESKYVETSNI